MVINIRLIDRQTADRDDPLPRDWWGYDANATPEQLWDHNRGIWSPSSSRLAVERWAALNYQGQVVLVAELLGPDHEILTDNRTGASKKALIGRVLPAEHPVHKALIGAQVEYRRNPVSYDKDPASNLADGGGPPEIWDAAGASGQGLQMDADTRKAIENAAQDRLMHHYRNDGWNVIDTHHNRPYDAVAVGVTSGGTWKRKAPRAEGARSSSPREMRPIMPASIRGNAYGGVVWNAVGGQGGRT